jgi:hypothetical protein
MKLATKKMIALLLAVGIVVGMSSCKAQQGCPSNFSLEISE